MRASKRHPTRISKNLVKNLNVAWDGLVMFLNGAAGYDNVDTCSVSDVYTREENVVPVKTKQKVSGKKTDVSNVKLLNAEKSECGEDQSSGK